MDSYKKLSRDQIGFAAFYFVMNTIYPPPTLHKRKDILENDEKKIVRT